MVRRFETRAVHAAEQIPAIRKHLRSPRTQTIETHVGGAGAAVTSEEGAAEGKKGCRPFPVAKGVTPAAEMEASIAEVGMVSLRFARGSIEGTNGHRANEPKGH